ncbi:MAG: hydrogenase maturation nickel metallochaperone HypA [Desulfuromonadales bacterium]
MHELSLTQSLIEAAVDHAKRAKAERILSVTVEIGALSGVIADAVLFAYDVCSRDTLAEGSRLEIRHIAGRGHCLDCQREAEITTLTHVCPHCSSLALRIVQGEEMKFTEMEID